MATPKTALPVDVYLDGDVHHQIIVGARERIETSRHFNKPIAELLGDGNEEALAYLAWLACRRNTGMDVPDKFDEFVKVLIAVEPDLPDDEDGNDADDEEDGDRGGRD
jgi:hypothetical protein